MGAATRNLNAKLAAGFSPKSATGDVDARFLAWAQTAVDAVDCGDHGHGGGQWVGRHGDMGNGMQFDLPRMLVQSLPIDVESAGFDPTASLCIPDRSFLAFARSQTTEVGHREIASPTPFGLCQPTNLGSPQIVSQSPCKDSQDASLGVPPLALPPGLPPPDDKVPAVDDPVPEFLVKWGLNEGSEQLLRSMPDKLMRDVIASFAPSVSTRNLNAKLAAGFSPKSATGDVDARFLAWAQTAVNAADCGYHGHGGGQWVGRHGDMGNGMQFDLPRMLVQSLPIDVESAGFDPTASLCNPDRSFLAFARSQTTEVGHREIASPTPFGLCQPTNLGFPQIVSQSPCEDSQDASSGVPPLVLPLALPPPDEKAPAVDDPVPEFLVKWGLDEGSEQLLRSMPDKLMRDVIASFAPPVSTRNLNAKLAAFAAAKQAKSPSVSPKGAIRAKPRSLPASPQASSAAPAGAVKQLEETVHQFTSAWGLDEGAAQMLAELPMEICVGVLTDFDPPPNTQNISARFEAFVRGRLATSSQGFCGNPVGGSQSGDPVTNFVIQWGLDAQSELTLRTLRPKQLAAVLRGFHPAQGTLNINAKFSAFTRSVTSRDAIGSTGSGAGTSIGGSGGKIATVGDADAVASFVL